MKYFIGTDEDGRILVSTDVEEYADENMYEFELPDDFDFATQDEYRIVDGELVHDPRPVPADQQIAELKSKLAETDYVAIKVYEAMVSEEAIPDEDATRYAEIITQRKEWRQQINQLESEVNQNGEHA